MTVPAWVKASAASLGLGGILGVTLAMIVLGSECAGWKADHPKPPKPVPTELQPTAAEAEMERIIEECLAIETLAPTPKERKRIAKESGRPEFARPPAVQSTNAPIPASPAKPGEIGPQIGSSDLDYPVLLAELEVPPMPDGGKAWVWLEMNHSVTVVTKANDPKPKPADRFWSFSPVYEIGAMADVENLLAREVSDWKAWGAVEIGRAGRIRPKLQVEGESRAGEKDLRGWVGAVWRSK